MTSIRQTLLPILTKLQHAPTPFMTVFLLVHLSAPVIANIGGSEAASQVMLLGREYYQGRGEPWLVYGPLALHVVAGILKRGILSLPVPISSRSGNTGTANDNGDNGLDQKPKKRPFPFSRPTVLTATAYISLLLIPVHINLNRLLPSSPSPPVNSLGPGELDYEFVKAGFMSWKWGTRSWILYGTLVTCVAIHACEGFSVIRRIWGGNVITRRSRRLVAGFGALIVLSGLARVATEPLTAFSGQVDRYMSVYTMSPWYRY